MILNRVLANGGVRWVTGVWVVLAICIGQGRTQQVDGDISIPPGVRYKRAPAAINHKAQLLLQTAFSAPVGKVKESALFSSVVVCGPLLWDDLKLAAQQAHLSGKPMGVMIPLPNGQVLRKEGRGFITAQQIHLFWQLLRAHLAPQLRGKAILAHPAGPAAIKYFWATIPFDIEEPLLTMSLPRQQLVVNFDTTHNEPKISWLDVVGDLNNLH